MQTKNLCELKKLMPMPLASCKPNGMVIVGGQMINTPLFQKEDFKNLTSSEFTKVVFEMVRERYMETITHNMSQVNSIFMEIYDTPIRFKERVSDLLIKIKNVMVQTGKSIEQVVKEIRKYLGYDCQFFRMEGDRRIPINSERIMKAHFLVEKKELFIKVEDALYF